MEFLNNARVTNRKTDNIEKPPKSGNNKVADWSFKISIIVLHTSGLFYL